MESIKTVITLELSIYHRDRRLPTLDTFGIYSTLFNCLKGLLQFENLTEQQMAEFLMEKEIRIEHPIGDYVYRAVYVDIDGFLNQ